MKLTMSTTDGQAPSHLRPIHFIPHIVSKAAGGERTFCGPQFVELPAPGRNAIAERCSLERATQPDAGGDDIRALADFFAKR